MGSIRSARIHEPTTPRQECQQNDRADDVDHGFDGPGSDIPESQAFTSPPQHGVDGDRDPNDCDAHDQLQERPRGHPLSLRAASVRYSEESRTGCWIARPTAPATDATMNRLPTTRAVVLSVITSERLLP